MALLWKVYLAILVIVTAAFAKSPVLLNAPEDATNVDTKSYRLSTDVKPLHYDLDLIVDLEKDFTFKGSVGILFTPLKSTTTLQFHVYEKIKLQHVAVHKLNGQKPENTDSDSYNATTNIYTMKFIKTLEEKQNYTLTIDYESPLADDGRGFYKHSYLTKDRKLSWYAVSHFEPVSARRAFPCFDEPSFKATFLVSIIHDPKYTAISNMPVNKLRSVNHGGKIKTKTSFDQTPMMSTYLVAFAVTDFKVTLNGTMGVWGRFNTSDMSQFAADTGVEVLKQLGEFTGVPYALPKMDQIALPLLTPGAMENWGLVTYRETHLLFNKTVNATSDLQKTASIISHEFAHQWFGNLVSPKWWQYLWLNEGFATYFEYYITDKIFPELRFMEQFLVTTLQGRAFSIDVSPKSRPMNYDHPPDQESISALFDNVAYHKAGSVIRMISHVLGEEKFKAALKQYLQKNQYKNAASKDLFEEFENVAKDLKFNANMFVLFDSWVNKTGYPVVYVMRDGKTDKVTVKQSRFLLNKEGINETDTKWWVPLTYTEEKQPNFVNTTTKRWLSPNDNSIEIDNINKDGWVIFNIQQTGYYRVQYSDNDWKAIAKFLKDGNISTIHPLNRAQLIDDALNLARAELLNYSIALDVLNYLPRENDYIVMSAVYANFAFLNKMLLTTPDYPTFQKFVAHVSESLLNQVKFEESEKDSYTTKLNRIQAMKWACDSGSTVCLKHTSNKMKEWLKSPSTSKSLSENLKKITLCSALRNSTSDEWYKIYYLYVRSHDANEKNLLLSVLGCSLKEEILKTYLDLATQADSVFASRPQAVFKAIYTSSNVGLKVAAEYIMNNVDVIKAHDKSATNNLVTYTNDIVGTLVSKEELEKWKAFVDEHSLPYDRVKDSLENAGRNVNWYKKNGATVKTWMKNYIENVNSKPSKTEGNSANSMTLASILVIVPILITRIY